MARTQALPMLLVVEDDPGLAGQYRWAFPGFEVRLAADRAAALALLRRERPVVAILDLGLPPEPDGVEEGFATLAEALRLQPGLKVVVVTSHGDRVHALRAVAAGASDFCDKPVDIEILRQIVDRTRILAGLEAENARLVEAAASGPIPRIVTASEPMLKVCRSVERLAATGVGVLLQGESGTGKEALAAALHGLGPRAAAPFEAINCGAIPEALLESELFGHERGAFTGAVARRLGRIEQAAGGTLFLDEIGDMPLPLQVKLLRFLQEQVVQRIGGKGSIAVDVRVVAATNQSLQHLVTEGRFRADLLYRLNAVTLRVPPLRERPGDATLLARVFLTRGNRAFGRSLRGFSAAALAAIEAHDWPGNVRELENRVKRAVVMAEGRLIEPEDLELAEAGAALPPLDLRAARLRAEREVLGQALAREGGRVAAAARLLGVSRPTLYDLLATHGLAVPEPEDGAAAMVAS